METVMRKSMYLFLALLLAFAFVGCKDPEKTLDRDINGIWYEKYEYRSAPRYIFNNGYFEEYTFLIITGEADEPIHILRGKGTYTINDNKITIKYTHFNGCFFRDLCPDHEYVKMYTKNEIETALVAYENVEGNYEHEYYVSKINDWFSPYSFYFSVNDNTLTITFENGYVETLTRK
jgi:hypothetical protein